MASKLMSLTLLLLLLVNVVLCLPVKPDDEANAEEEPTVEGGGGGGGEENLTGEEEEEEFCIICRDDFLEEPALEVQCGHKYHKSCLVNYAKSNRGFDKCFMCQERLITKDNQDVVQLCDDEQQRLLDEELEHYEEDEQEVARNKMKLGVIASLGSLPTYWYQKPARWYGPGIYFGSAVNPR